MQLKVSASVRLGVELVCADSSQTTFEDAWVRLLWADVRLAHPVKANVVAGFADSIFEDGPEIDDLFDHPCWGRLGRPLTGNSGHMLRHLVAWDRLNVRSGSSPQRMLAQGPRQRGSMKTLALHHRRWCFSARRWDEARLQGLPCAAAEDGLR